MREGQEGDVDIQDVRKPVFQALLYFTYTDQLPEVQQSCSLMPGFTPCSHFACLHEYTCDTNSWNISSNNIACNRLLHEHYTSIHVATTVTTGSASDSSGSQGVSSSSMCATGLVCLD